MLKLIKLEWKKNEIGRYIRNAVILTLLLCIFVFAQNFLGIANDPDTGVPDTAPGNEAIETTIELFSSISYLVFTGVMLSSFIVNAYKNKTMNLMFSYPIKRQKILISQMLAVWIFNVMALIITKFLMYSVVVIGSKFIEASFISGFNILSVSFYIQVILKSMVTVTMGFIALFIGLALKSSKVTIITSFLLFALTEGTIGDITLRDNLIFPLALTGISLLFAFLSVYRVEIKDLI